MKALNKILAATLIALASWQAPAAAQSVSPGLTPGCSSPPPAYGVVWTASQWIVCLTSLQPFLGYIPLNAGGGAMSGELILSPSVTTNAPLNFQLGVAPTSPVNGDFWFTSAGAFYRAGGVTVGPLASTTSQTFVDPTFTGTVTLPSGATFTTAGGQGFPHLYINRTTDAGGAQNLQVAGNGYMSGGLSLGATAAVSNGLFVGSVGAPTLTANGQASVSASTTGGGVLSGEGSTNDVQLVNKSGAIALAVPTGTTNIAVGASGTVTSVSGTITVASGGGVTTALSDTTIRLSNSGYHTCDLLGTDSSGNITCGGAPSGYITYNDNVTTSTLAVSGNLYCMDTASGALNLTLPASPGNGAYVAFSDCGGNFGNHNLTIVRNGSNIMYNAGDMVVSTRYAGAVLRYSLGNTSWILSPL